MSCVRSCIFSDVGLIKDLCVGGVGTGLREGGLWLCALIETCWLMAWSFAARLPTPRFLGQRAEKEMDGETRGARISRLWLEREGELLGGWASDAV